MSSSNFSKATSTCKIPTYCQDGSGSPNNPVVYTNYNSETVLLSGGVEIPSTNWKNYIGNTLVTNLKVLGIFDYGELTKKQSNKLELFFNDNPMQLARYPNRYLGY